MKRMHVACSHIECDFFPMLLLFDLLKHNTRFDVKIFDTADTLVKCGERAMATATAMAKDQQLVRI